MKDLKKIKKNKMKYYMCLNCEEVYGVDCKSNCPKCESDNLINITKEEFNKRNKKGQCINHSDILKWLNNNATIIIINNSNYDTELLWSSDMDLSIEDSIIKYREKADDNE